MIASKMVLNHNQSLVFCTLTLPQRWQMGEACKETHIGWDCSQSKHHLWHRKETSCRCLVH